MNSTMFPVLGHTRMLPFASDIFFNPFFVYSAWQCLYIKDKVEIYRSQARRLQDPWDSAGGKVGGKVDKIEMMSHEEAEKMATLANKLLTVIEVETDYTYQDVMRALDSIKKNYEKKGSDLLNSASIQEVAMFGGLLN